MNDINTTRNLSRQKLSAGITFAPQASATDPERPAIEPMMALRPLADADTDYELLVYGDIGDSWWGESVTARSVADQIRDLPEGTERIHVRINSYGGSVADGLAIYNQLRRFKGEVLVTVDGVAMSSASLIAMAGKTVMMPAASMLMIHAPWGGVIGNARALRKYADVLDTFSEAMTGAYQRKSGMDREEALALLTDGEDHYYTGEEAVAAGFADELVDADEEEPDEQARAFASGLLERFAGRAPESVAQLAVAAALRSHHPAASDFNRPAQPDHNQETAMRNRTKRRPMNRAGQNAGGGGAANPAPTNPATEQSQPQDTATVQAAVHTAMRERNEQIRNELSGLMHVEAVSQLCVNALADPSMSVDQVRQQALGLMAAQAGPTASPGTRVDAGPAEADKRRAAGVDFLLARAGVMNREDSERARQGNPYLGMSMVDMAKDSLARAGGDVSAFGGDKQRIVRAAITHSTSDFPNLLENALHKALINAYTQTEQTWRRFCRVGSLADFRPHIRLYGSSFADLLPVGENGEYKDGSMGDAEKQSITAGRKGRILNISREMIVNDDVGAFNLAAVKLGQAAARTLEKDVYALFELNGGNGPTMGDGLPLFDAGHSNIAAVAAAPSMTSFDAARVQLALQRDPGGNDILDLNADLWLGPKTIGGLARSINDSQYDPDATSKLQKPNIVRGLFSDIIDTGRLTGTPWYALAAPSIEPVFEVGFLDGIQAPQMEMEESFRTDGISWRVRYEYGVAAVGYRGIVKNPGNGG